MVCQMPFQIVLKGHYIQMLYMGLKIQIILLKIPIENFL